MVVPVFQLLLPAKRVLIFRGGALGDFLLTLPVFQGLRRIWPQSDITVVGISHIAELARVFGLVDHVLSIDSTRFGAYYVSDVPLPPAESAFLHSFDLVISFLHDPDGALRMNWKHAGARNVVSVSPQVTSGHAADHFLYALESLEEPCSESGPSREFSGRPRSGMGIPFLDRAPSETMKKCVPSGSSAGLDGPCSFRAAPGGRLELPAEIQAAGRIKLESLGLSGPVVAMHPGSGSHRKNWPLTSFRALAERIHHTALGRILWIVGEADDAIARSLEQEHMATPMLTGCSLPDVAAVLSQCRGYVGNDSGITHLAATVGIPTVALFGPTDPEVWAPRGRHVAVIRSQPPMTEGLARITVDDVWQGLKNTVYLSSR